MKSRVISAIMAILLVATLAGASSNLNSSRSNTFRLTYPSDLVNSAQAQQILAELEKMGPAGEAKLKQWLLANFKRHGIDGARVKKIIVMPRGGDLKEIGVIVLTNPADEPQARAATIKSSKSNSSD